MPTTFLTIHLALQSDEPLEQIQSQVHEDLEFFYADRDCKVFSVTWDREQARKYVEELSKGHVPEVVKPEPAKVALLTTDAATVLGQHNLTLSRKWFQKGCLIRVPKKPLYGEQAGNHTLRGRILVTNGVLALMLVGGDAAPVFRWAEVLWNNFVPDNLDDLDEDLPKPQRKEPVRTKKEMHCFEGL